MIVLCFKFPRLEISKLNGTLFCSRAFHVVERVLGLVSTPEIYWLLSGGAHLARLRATALKSYVKWDENKKVRTCFWKKIIFKSLLKKSWEMFLSAAFFNDYDLHKLCTLTEKIALQCFIQRGKCKQILCKWARICDKAKCAVRVCFILFNVFSSFWSWRFAFPLYLFVEKILKLRFLLKISQLQNSYSISQARMKINIV